MRFTNASEAPLARVAELDAGDLRWSYVDKAPHWYLEPAIPGNWRRPQAVDPWGPCYRHDPDRVCALLAECVAVAPLITAPVTVYVSIWEGLERTNGWAMEDAHHGDPPDWWRGPGEKAWEGVIALSGRRVEIHPAITRYVVPHEYGHLVEDALARLRYPGDVNGESKLRAEYARVRRLEAITHYGAGTHHLAPGEVFANDFRAYVLEKEREFWPHPVKPAWQLKRVARWLETAMAELRGAAAMPKLHRCAPASS
jgi:hypothetical protein